MLLKVSSPWYLQCLWTLSPLAACCNTNAECSRSKHTAQPTGVRFSKKRINQLFKIVKAFQFEDTTKLITHGEGFSCSAVWPLKNSRGSMSMKEMWRLWHIDGTEEHQFQISLIHTHHKKITLQRSFHAGDSFKFPTKNVGKTLKCLQIFKLYIKQIKQNEHYESFRFWREGRLPWIIGKVSTALRVNRDDIKRVFGKIVIKLTQGIEQALW